MVFSFFSDQPREDCFQSSSIRRETVRPVFGENIQAKGIHDSPSLLRKSSVY